MHSDLFECFLNPHPLGCVQNRIQIGGFGTHGSDLFQILLNVFSNICETFSQNLIGQHVRRIIFCECLHCLVYRHHIKSVTEK